MRQIYKQQLTDVTLDGVTEAPASSSSHHDDDGGDGGGAGKKRKNVTKRGRRQKNATRGVAFSGVMGDKGEEGELFGLENLLQVGQDRKEMERAVYILISHPTISHNTNTTAVPGLHPGGAAGKGAGAGGGGRSGRGRRRRRRSRCRWRGWGRGGWRGGGDEQGAGVLV